MNRRDKTEENVKTDDVPHAPLTQRFFFSFALLCFAFRFLSSQKSCVVASLPFALDCCFRFIYFLSSTNIRFEFMRAIETEIFARNLIQIQHANSTNARYASTLKSNRRCECLAELITVIRTTEKIKISPKAKLRCNNFVRNLVEQDSRILRNWLRCLWFEQKPLAVIARQGLRSYDIHDAYISVRFICSFFFFTTLTVCR